ncbi:MAG: peptidyl-prolyl cis-trans isomerase [Paracoccaceae bacterium]
MKYRNATPVFVAMMLFASFVYANDTFAPKIQVDDMLITQYEIDQRALFFELLKFPGNHKKEAEKSLINDRLKLRAAEKLGVEANPAAVKIEMEMFAQRGNLTINEFAKRLKKAGVDRITWESYAQIPILWLETVSRKFAPEIASSMANNDLINYSASMSEIQVLLTEIIIPVQLGFEEETNQRIESLRRTKSLKKFSEAASKYSVAPTRDVGGKVKWQNLSDLPAVVKPLISGLSKGEVSEPLPIPGGIAIFQLREIRESRYSQSNSKFVNYIEFIFKKNKKTNDTLISNVLMCDDLYTFSNSIQQAEISRNNVKENLLSKELQNILSELDENEFIIQDNDNFTSKVLMVCGRTEKENLSKSDISDISRRLANKRLFNLANSYLENLRQEARIVFK